MSILFALRPQQWIKNLLIFVPLVFGKQLFNSLAFLKSVAVFFIFSLTAGTGYLINDLLDLKKDKCHPKKHLRHIASGKISIKQTQITALVLGVLSVTASFVLDNYFGWIIIAYLILNLIYTKLLKEIVMIDVFCLSAFFLLRIIGGSVIVGVRMSHWVILMTVLLALFLGFNKRRQELSLFGNNPVAYRPVLNKYSVHLIDRLTVVIIFLIVVSYTFYTVDERTVGYFGTGHLIYSAPFVFFGIFRYLYLIHKLNQDGDPTRMLLSDKIMKIDLVLWVIVCILVIYFKL